MRAPRPPLFLARAVYRRRRRRDAARLLPLLGMFLLLLPLFWQAGASGTVWTYVFVVWAGLIAAAAALAPGLGGSEGEAEPGEEDR